jgi:hypothetical protein
MALDFPNSPTNGQVFTSGTKKWTWDGSYWNASNITPNATTTTDGSMSSTDKTRLDDASATNGIVKCNGSGDFSAAVAGTDYLTSTSLSGSPAAAKAWGQYNGATQSLNRDYKILSVTRNSIGNYTINFDTGTVVTTNYSIVLGHQGQSVTIDTKTTSSFRLRTYSSGLDDLNEINFVIFE